VPSSSLHFLLRSPNERRVKGLGFTTKLFDRVLTYDYDSPEVSGSDLILCPRVRGTNSRIGESGARV